MTKWVTKKLGDLIIDSYAGGTPNRGRDDYYGGDIPWVSSGEVNNPEITSTIENITLAGLANSSAKWIPANSILVALYGATAGQVSMLRIKATSNQAVLAIIPNQEIVDTNFLYNQIKFNKQALLFLAQGSGQPNLSKNIVDRLEITFPESLTEQKRIASILSSADNVIATSEALIEKYKHIKQGMLTDLLTPKKGWKKVKLGDVGTFKNGINKDKSQFGFGKMYISISDAYFEQIDFKLLNRLNATEKEVEEYSLITDDIIFVRSSVKPSGVGYTTLFEGYEKEPVLYSGFMIRYRLNDKNSHCAKFLNYLFRSDEFRRQVINKSTVSANTNINQESLKELVCFIPDLTEQRRIAAILSSVDAKIAAEEKVVEKYKGVKKGLMEEMMGSEK